MSNNIAHYEKLFNSFEGQNLEILDLYYSKEVIFEDPSVRVEGLIKLKKYFSYAYKNVVSIHFDFLEFHQLPSQIYLHWKMTARIKGLNGGKEIQVLGLSSLSINADGKITSHRDYFDLGALVYENIPFLGRFVRKIKQQLHGDLN